MSFFKKQQTKVEVEVKVCNHKVCYKCGYLFETGGEDLLLLDCFNRKQMISFCKNCAPKNCDYIRDYFIDGIHYFRHQPDIEVNEKGEPIKKK